MRLLTGNAGNAWDVQSSKLAAIAFGVLLRLSGDHENAENGNGNGDSSAEPVDPPPCCVLDEDRTNDDTQRYAKDVIMITSIAEHEETYCYQTQRSLRRY